jgi:hypothetical protein
MTKEKINPKEDQQKVDFTQMQSFEDFCKARNIDPTQLPGVDNLPEEFREPLIAVYRIMVGVSAVNEGKKVDFTKNTDKYFAYARVLSSGSGFDFSNSSSHYVTRGSGVGSRLCTDSDDKTMHVFKVLNDDYKTWLI